jgi:hypothetical protein
MSLAATEAQCHNCDTALLAVQGKFCHECGQNTKLHVPTVAEFFHEFVNHYVAAEGKLWRTLATLFFRPGVLTRDYLVGRRERYVLPLKLFLTFSIVFFIALKMIQPPVKFMPTPAQNQAAMKTAGKPMAQLTQSERQTLALRSLTQNGPFAAFFLLPIFAVLLRVLYSSRKLNFGSHLVFAFHFHTVVFALLLIGLLAPATAVTLGLIAAGTTYLLFALHNAYGGRFWLTTLRGAALTALHGSIIMLTVAVVTQAPVV